MLFHSFVTIALATLGLVVALPAEPITRCGVELSDDQVSAMNSQFENDLAAAGPSLASAAIADEVTEELRMPITPIPHPTFTIPHPTFTIHPPPPPPPILRRRVNVYWHVVSGSNNANDGYLSDAAVKSSIIALNQHYASTSFTFVLASTTRTQNADWFNNAAQSTAQQNAMKHALHVGGASSLNVYSVGFKGKGLLGYATFPQSYNGNPTDDGVVIRWDSVPGGTAVNFNQGKTLTHEVGHWLGLYHVFGGTCSSDGDGVPDTPIQQTPTNGCPATKDSCPNQPGLDSIHNFLDYSYDACMNQFTPGQTMRMIQQSAMYRGIQLTAGI